jgi:acylphosphatase
MAPSTASERRQVIYRGRVQGVGFRFTARQLAQGYAVTGFVKNLDDGGVQLVAEGAPEVLDRFLMAIAEQMGTNIRQAETANSQPTGQFTSFEIAY